MHACTFAIGNHKFIRPAIQDFNTCVDLWSEWQGSNLRPEHWKCPVLSTELHSLIFQRTSFSDSFNIFFIHLFLNTRFHFPFWYHRTKFLFPSSQYAIAPFIFFMPIYLVPRSGIEPLSPSWKDDDITSSPTGRAFLALVSFVYVCVRVHLYFYSWTFCKFTELFIIFIYPVPFFWRYSFVLACFHLNQKVYRILSCQNRCIFYPCCHFYFFLRVTWDLNPTTSCVTDRDANQVHLLPLFFCVQGWDWTNVVLINSQVHKPLCHLHIFFKT